MTKMMMLVLPLQLLLGVLPAGAQGRPRSKEYLTEDEITKIQDAQEIDLRTKLYMQAAALRLKVAEARLNGKESAPDDPMEFFSAEDMLDGYYQIVRSVMTNLDDAYQKPGGDRAKIVKALKNLKESTERAIGDLEIIKAIAEEKKLEDAWNLTNQALDIARGAHEGAELGLAGQPPDEKEKTKKKKP
jgi:hypothetical protein